MQYISISISISIYLFIKTRHTLQRNMTVELDTQGTLKLYALLGLFIMNWLLTSVADDKSILQTRSQGGSGQLSPVCSLAPRNSLIPIKNCGWPRMPAILHHPAVSVIRLSTRDALMWDVGTFGRQTSSQFHLPQRCTRVGSIHGLGWIGSRNVDQCTMQCTFLNVCLMSIIKNK